jgi:hypothetical protein
MRRRATGAVLATLGLAAGGARAAEDPGAPAERSPALLTGTTPPPSNRTFVQYGVSFTGEFVASPGPLCNDAAPAASSGVGAGATPPCILGGGGGIAFRLGFRGNGPWYFGGAYESTKQDPNKLYRLAILQQLRGEARYYIDTGREWQPYGGGGLGLAGYGDEWTVDTWGPSAFTALGAEWQISRATLLGFGVSYRLMHFGRFVDSSKTERPPGISQIVGLEVSLEGRDAL